MAETENKSSLTIYSLGIVTEPNTLDTDYIKVSPIEHINIGKSGYIKDSEATRAGSLPDKDGTVTQSEVKSSDILTAKWLPLAQNNKSSPPNVVANDTVLLFKFGDDSQYWWVSLFRGPGAGGVRTGKETANYSWCNSSETAEATGPVSAGMNDSVNTPSANSNTTATGDLTSNTGHDDLTRMADENASTGPALVPTRRKGTADKKTPSNFSSSLGEVSGISDNRSYDDSKTYWFEVSTENKHIILRTSSNDGEFTGWTFKLDTSAGVLKISDDQDNFIKMEAKLNKISIESKLDIKIKALNKLELECEKEITVKAKTIKIKEGGISIPSTSKVKIDEGGGTMTMDGNLRVNGRIIATGGIGQY